MALLFQDKPGSVKGSPVKGSIVFNARLQHIITASYVLCLLPYMSTHCDARCSLTFLHVEFGPFRLFSGITAVLRYSALFLCLTKIILQNFTDIGDPVPHTTHQSIETLCLTSSSLVNNAQTSSTADTLTHFFPNVTRVEVCSSPIYFFNPESSRSYPAPAQTPHS